MFIKVTVTGTGCFYDPPNELTARCLLQLCDDQDQHVIKSFVVGVRGETTIQGQKNQKERAESFLKFIEENQGSIQFASVVLYKDHVDLAGFDSFIKKFEAAWGKDQNQGYQVLLNNCSDAVGFVLDYFFSEEYMAKFAYEFIKFGPSILMMALAFAQLELVSSNPSAAINLIIHLLGLTAVIATLGSVMPGRIPLVIPIVNIPNNVLLRAKLLSFFSPKVNQIILSEKQNPGCAHNLDFNLSR